MLPSLTLDRRQPARTASPLVAPDARDRSRDATPAPAVRFALVDSRAGFDALEEEWNALFAAAGSGGQVFQQFNWLWHWANHFLGHDGRPGNCRLAIVTGRLGGRLVLVWPTVVSRAHPVRQLSWMGEPVSQYGDVLMDAVAIEGAGVGGSARVLRESWRYLRETVRPDVVHLRKVREDSTVAAMLRDTPSVRSNEAEAPFLALEGAPSFACYEQRYSAKARKNRRRLMRRLSERAAIEFETHRDGAEAGRLAALAVSLKRAWLRERGQLSPALADPRTGAFFADACSGQERPTGARISVLRSGGEPASIEIGFEAKGTLALHIIVYGLKFEKSGAGVLHLEQGIRQCFEDGVQQLDLLAPRADYKMDWADGVVRVADHSVPVTLAGWLYASTYLGFVRAHAKHVLNRLPLAVRRSLS